MRFYIVDNEGRVLGEADTLQQAQALMECKFTQKEIEENEIEVIEG